MEEEKLFSVLEKYGLPVRRQGSLGEQEGYPDSFFTFWNRDSMDQDHYDNHSVSAVCIYDINFYSNDPELVYDRTREAIRDLKAAGFVISGYGHDAASDEKSHTGRGFEAVLMVTTGAEMQEGESRNGNI